MCPVCRAQISAGALTCHRCGAELPPSCKSCGAPVSGGAELCANCRTERLPIADLGEVSSAGDLSGAVGARSGVLRRLAALATEAARERQVRFCVVTGPPGVGKTRLMRELAHALTTRCQPALRVLGGSTGGEGAPAYAVFGEQLYQRFDIDPREPETSAREKLMAGCRALLPGPRSAEAAHLLGEMLRLPFPDSPLSEPRAGGARPEPRMYLAVKRLLSADAARGPLALFFDEMEHAPTETVNLLHYLSAGLAQVPVFLCVFGRPELYEAHPSFGQGEAPCERIDLGPLSLDDSLAVFRGFVQAAGDPPPKVLRHVEQKLSGSPRAILELVRLLQETGALRLADEGGRGPGWDLIKLQRIALPATLEDLVTARLQVMDPSHRELLERAATCGEHFWVDAVVALIRCTEAGLGVPREHSGGTPPQVQATDPDGPTLEEIVVSGDRATHEVTESLRQLTQTGLLMPLPHSTISGEREYRFAYPPWRDVIYEAIPGRTRRRYHGLLAQWLDLTPDGRREEMQEAIGRHLERAGKGDYAARRYRRAAEAAKERYAHAKATRLFARAIACLGTEDLATRIMLWHELGTVFHQKGDYDNALSAYEKVVRLSWLVASRGKAALALLHMGQIWRQKGESQLSLDYLGQALDLFKQAVDQRGVADTLDDIGQVLWLLGRYDEALDRSAAALESRRRQGDRRQVAASLLHIGNIERHRGLFEEADACYREALAIERAEGDKTGVAACLNATGMLSHQRGDRQAARRSWEEALQLVEEVGASPLQPVMLCHLGEQLLEQGALGEAEARFTAARGLARELSDKRLLSETTRLLGLLALRKGDSEEALLLCESALQLAEDAGIRVDVGRALLSLGEVHAATLFGQDHTPNGFQAREYFRRGVALFREIGNEAELGHGLARLGRYHVEFGEVKEGRALLTEAEGIFSRLKMRAGEDLRQMLSEL